MKTLKFTPELCEMILRGEKRTTWRLFDDKDLKTGDQLELVNRVTGEVIGHAQIISCSEKKLGEVTKDDYTGHETYTNDEEMLETYRGYYGDGVNWETIVKIIKFELLK